MVVGVVSLVLHRAGLLNAARGGKKIWQGVSLERSGHPFSTKHDEFWSCFLVETALRAFLASREATSIF